MARRTLLLIAAILVAAVGTGLIWYYVKSADDRARNYEATAQVYAPTEALVAGTSAEAALKQVPLKTLQVQGVPADALTPANASKIAGKSLLQRVTAGQALTVSMFGAAGSAPVVDGLDEKSLGVEVSLPDPNRVAGLLRHGSKITIFTTSGAGPEKTAQVLLPKVTVLSVGGTTVQGTTGIPQANVALQVDQTQAAKIFLALADKGTALWFALWGGDGVPIDPNQKTTTQNLYVVTP